MENNVKEVKISLPYKDDDGNIQVERVWAEKIGNTYRIVNVPFFANNVAYGDIIKAEEEEGELFFDELVTPSGHSTVQMIIYNKDEVPAIGDALVELGCDWEGSHLPSYISVDIPATVPYKVVKSFLEKGRTDNRWDFKEACIGHC